MSLPHQVARVTLSGTMFSGSEIWSTGFYMGNETADAGQPTNQGAADIGAAFATFFSLTANRISTQYKFTQCKVVMLNNDGRTMADSAVYWSPPSEVTGGSGTNVLPPQCSLALTLTNSLPRGLATKGRMYLPGVAVGVNASGKVDALTVGTIADNLKAFFDSITNDADTPGRPVLASVGRPPLLLGGAIRNVTTIKVGDVIDTQRRRRNALDEQYVARQLVGV